MKAILKHVGLIFLALLLFLFIVQLWLRVYTHHGQSLEMRDYVGMQVSDARQDAEDLSFSLVVLDSVFLVGKKGGEIVRQNPVPGAKVKEDRKIYVTISKNVAEQVPVRRLPILYGKDFERKRRELKQAFEIDSKIIGYSYDRGAPNHILEVKYQGQSIIDARVRKDQVMVEKGGTLEMILSKSSGAELVMPDLICKEYDEASFQLQTLNLIVGETYLDDEIRDKGSSFIWKQEPSASQSVSMGDTVRLYLTATAPEDCNF